MPFSAPVSFHVMPHGPRIAYRHSPGTGPAVVFLPGYRSDMSGSKAAAVLAWARQRGNGCLLLDYSGCGQSGGDFAEGTLSRWRDEVLTLIDHRGLDRVVLVGSSMGGWLMLLVAEALDTRVAGLVGIAAAPDFTDWGTDNVSKGALAAGQVAYADNAYGPDRTPTYPGFWTDGQAMRRLQAPIEFTGPVRLVQGQADPDVPWTVALRLAAALRSDDVQIQLIKDGDHRLSRDADIGVVLATLTALFAQVQGKPG